MVTPTIPDPVDLPDDFRCPRKLIFAFECTCHFNREGILEIPEFREFQCQQRAEAVRNNPGLGVKIARECHRAYGFLPEITASVLRATQDAIFDRCPRVLNKLCPDDPELEILECSCFMYQTGILEGATPEFIQDCIEEWGEVTSANRSIRRTRCKVSIKFKDFDGGLLGLVGRQCFQNSKEQCCGPLPL